jgi:hypothetical protein
MRLLVDADSLPDSPELPLLLSFENIEGFNIDSRITIVDGRGREPCAVIGEAGTHFVSIPPPDQTRRIAARIASAPDCKLDQQAVARAIVLHHVGSILNADLVVSPAADGISGSDANFFRRGKFVSVLEALAVIGTIVRQRDPVPLAGNPPLVQARPAVYSMTARWIVPGSWDLWALAECDRTNRERLQAYAGAMLDRVGQALRGRDGVQEALRVANGRSGIEDALYHFDVVLTSSVAALDTLARFAHTHLGLGDSKLFDAGWQKPGWIRQVEALRPSVAEVVAPDSRRGAQLRIITSTRNTIHGIPLQEVLHVEASNMECPVEHRVEMTPELADRLRRVGAPIAPLSDHGIFVEGQGPFVLNVGIFTEDVLKWLLALLGDLIGAMRASAQLEPVALPELSGLEGFQRQCLVALARVGEFPVERTMMGIRATQSLTIKMMGVRARALKKIRDERI